MPYVRIIGNILFSLMGNILIKNFKILDFLNGYISIDNMALKKVLKKIDNDYSNINIIKTGSTIFLKNMIYILGIKK